MAKKGLFGLDALLDAFKDVEKVVSDESGDVKKVIENHCKAILSKAKALCPVETGDLKRSGDWEVKKGLTGVTGNVSFSSPYAVKQHEDQTLNHPNGGQAKFLEQPYNESKAKIIKDIKDELAKGLGDM